MAPLLVALALAAPPPAPAAADLLGTYRVEATAELSGVSLAPSLDLRGDVTLRRGARPGAVRARLAARGRACELSGEVTAPGRVTFAPGQRCPLRLDEPEVRGDVEATLRSGEARAADGRLALALEVALAGTVRLSTGFLPGLGGETAVPVDGSATVRGEGSRDNSRAADPGVRP